MTLIWITLHHFAIIWPCDILQVCCHVPSFVNLGRREYTFSWLLKYATSEAYCEVEFRVFFLLIVLLPLDYDKTQYRTGTQYILVVLPGPQARSNCHSQICVVRYFEKVTMISRDRFCLMGRLALWSLTICTVKSPTMLSPYLCCILFSLVIKNVQLHSEIPFSAHTHSCTHITLCFDLKCLFSLLDHLVTSLTHNP